MPELLASQATIGHAHASRAWERTKRKQDAQHAGLIGGFIMIYTLFFFFFLLRRLLHMLIC